MMAAQIDQSYLKAKSSDYQNGGSKRSQLETRSNVVENASTGNSSEASKRDATSEIVQSIKEELSALELVVGNTNGVATDILNLGGSLQRLQDSYSSIVNFLPAFEQRLLQSRLKNMEKSLADQRKEKSSSQGFSFRRAAKVIPDSKETETAVVIPEIMYTVPDSIVKKVDPVPENVLQISQCENEQKEFDRVSVKGKDIVLKRLKNCQIVIKGASAVLQLTNLESCTVISAPIRTSVFVTNCCRCTFSLACQQLRIHDSSDLNCFVHLQSGGIIENCRNIRVAPYNVDYAEMREDFREAGFNVENNDNWKNFEDFDFVVSKKRSPNLTVIPENERGTIFHL